MNGSIINASVTMNALQQRLDLLAENIANVNTAGYKRKQGTFEDLLTNAKQQPEAFRKDGRIGPMGYNQGWGARFLQLGPDMTQGTLKETGTATDLAIEGNALFQVEADGKTAYTRSGAFQLTVRGNGDTILATEAGYPVLGTRGGAGQPGPIVVPAGVTLQISGEGVVEGVHGDGTRENLGQLSLVSPARPELLTPVEDNLFVVPDGIAAGDVLTDAAAGPDSGIAVRQGYVEQSNVNVVDEMTELLNVQRAYQLSARALTSADSMLGMANNMRG
ncbi:flagellar hook-basal body protein [Paenibacillus humicus]|uniref:flagellar hook-basal body protein n=1 Tax=Paenibacillus humicus TaxID=412861 RepID=UPI003F17CB6D